MRSEWLTLGEWRRSCREAVTASHVRPVVLRGDAGRLQRRHFASDYYKKRTILVPVHKLVIFIAGAEAARFQEQLVEGDVVSVNGGNP